MRLNKALIIEMRRQEYNMIKKIKEKKIKKRMAKLEEDLIE